MEFKKMYAGAFQADWFKDHICRNVYIWMLAKCSGYDMQYEPLLKRGEVYTSVRELAELTGYTVNQIRYAIAKLESLGIISRFPKCKSGNKALYKVNFEVYEEEFPKCDEKNADFSQMEGPNFPKWRAEGNQLGKHVGNHLGNQETKSEEKALPKAESPLQSFVNTQVESFGKTFANFVQNQPKNHEFSQMEEPNFPTCPAPSIEDYLIEDIYTSKSNKQVSNNTTDVPCSFSSLSSLSFAEREEQITEVIDYINETLKTRFQSDSEYNRINIRRQLNKGYSVEDCLLIVDFIATWDKKYRSGMDPQRIFVEEKFERRLNQALAGCSGNRIVYRLNREDFYYTYDRNLKVTRPKYPHEFSQEEYCQIDQGRIWEIERNWQDVQTYGERKVYGLDQQKPENRPMTAFEAFSQGFDA